LKGCKALRGVARSGGVKRSGALNGGGGWVGERTKPRRKGENDS